MQSLAEVLCSEETHDTILLVNGRAWSKKENQTIQLCLKYNKCEAVISKLSISISQVNTAEINLRAALG